VPAARPRRAAALAAAWLALAGTAAFAQAMYRWTDVDGHIHYADRLPKGYTGPFTVIQADVQATPSAPGTPGYVPPAVPAGAQPTEAAPGAPQDIGSKRRETRRTLEARVQKARDRLAAAKKAREEGDALQDEEHQMVQRTGRPSEFANVARSNCTISKDANGRPQAMCPALVPSEAYWDRIKGLDNAVKDAEADLDAAQEAYVRGVD
jgi:hypothetical protein